MPRIVHSNIVSSSERASNGNTGDLIAIGASNGRFLLAVTADAGGTAELDIQVEGKMKSGIYVPIGNFAKIDKIGSQSIEITRLTPIYRIRWAVSKPMVKFTFEIDALIDCEL